MQLRLIVKALPGIAAAPLSSAPPFYFRPFEPHADLIDNE
jgi:hypothetical protein